MLKNAILVNKADFFRIKCESNIHILVTYFVLPFETVKNVLEIKQFTQLHKIIFENAQFVIGSNTLKTFIEKIYSQYIISHFLPYL